MLKITENGFGTDTLGSIASELGDLSGARKFTYIIVPEQQTVITERRMADELPPSHPLKVEVTNFTRLANTVFRSLGGLSGKYITPAARSVIMWRALAETMPMLKTMSGDPDSGKVARMLSAVDEMQSLRIHEKELSDIYDSIRLNERLSNKIFDLMLVMKTYKLLCGEKFSDSGEDLDKMCEKLSETPGFFSGCRFYIAGFTSFTEQEYAVFEELIRSSDATVYLTIPKNAPSEYPFTELIKFRRRLTDIARRAKVDITLEKSSARPVRKSSLIQELSDVLWSTDANIVNISCKSDDTVRIFEADDPFESSDFIAADIVRRVQDGASWSDFAVIARNAEDYRGILDLSFEKYSIPCHFSVRDDISSFEAVKLIYSAYAAVCGGFARGDVISYAKCSMSGITPEKCDEFESYAAKWELDGKNFTDGTVWNMNPDGYTDKMRAGAAELLAAVNETKKKISDDLHMLSASTGRLTVTKHAEILVRFLLQLRVPESIEAVAMREEARGNITLAEENLRLWETICSALDTLTDAAGEAEVIGDEFCELLKTVFSKTDMGKIPATVDEVTVGSADTMRLGDSVKHAYMIGVNKGEFPRTVTNDGYFSDSDCLTLSTAGLAIEPETDVRAAREMFIFSRAFTCSSESITLLFSDLSPDLSRVLPSVPIKKISEATSGAVSPVRVSSLPKDALIYSAEAAFEALGNTSDAASLAAVRNVLSDLPEYSGRLSMLGHGILNDTLRLTEDGANSLYGKKMNLTQSRIDAYLRCPLAHFASYPLYLDTGEKAEFNALNIGNFIHSVLEKFFSSLKENGIDIRMLSEEDRRRFTEEATRGYINSVTADGQEHKPRTEKLFSNILNASLMLTDELCDEFRNSRFSPSFFELRIDSLSPDLPSPPAFHTDDGTEVTVYGTADRVDTYKLGNDVYVRVIDYKTGNKNFSPEDIDKSQNLQLFLYLTAITETGKEGFRKLIGVGEGGRMIPAGVLYLKTKTDPIDSNSPPDGDPAELIKAQQVRSGMLINDPDILSAMDTTGSGRYIPVKYEKNGEVKNSESMFSEEDWPEIRKRTEAAVLRVAKKMKSGDISASPLLDNKHKNTCESCRFKPICRNARVR